MSSLKQTAIAVLAVLFASVQVTLANLNGPHGGATDWACTNMHFWSVGSFFHAIQFDEWQDAQGYPCESTNAVRQPTYTVAELYLGGSRSYRVRVRMAVWQIGVCVLLATAAVIGLSHILRKRTRKTEQT